MAKANTAKKNEVVTTKLSGAMADFGTRFKVVRQVTLPTFKLTVGVPIAFKIDEAIKLGKKLKGKAAKNEDGSERAPVELLSVTNLDTGEVGQIVLPAVLKGNLEDTYPDETYVGKSFAILKGDKPAGKRYNQYSIMEIEAA